MSKRTSNPSDGDRGAGAARPAGDGAAGSAERRPQALLVVTGADHPGILDDISHFVTDRGAQIEAVRVVNLRGRFALLMLVSGAEPAMKTITAELPGLSERTGIRATIEAAHDADGGLAAGTSFALSAAGGSDADESTALRQTSNLLRVLNINIRDVETKRTTGGGFDMRMKIDVPRDVPVSKLRELLGQLLARQPLDWDLSATSDEQA